MSLLPKDSKGKTISSSNYTVTYAKGRKSIGEYSVTVKFKGTKYTGTKTLKFTILPKASKFTKITSVPDGFKLKWSKVSGVTGYQIRYTTNSTKFKTKTIKKSGTTTASFSKLKMGKNLGSTVQIRTYKTVKVNGKSKNIYSKWSSEKTAYLNMSKGLLFTKSSNGKYYAVVNWTESAARKLTIPSKYNGKKVTSISSFAIAGWACPSAPARRSKRIWDLFNCGIPGHYHIWLIN